MESSTMTPAQKQAVKSIDLGLVSFFGTPLVSFSLGLWHFVYFHPLSSPTEATYTIEKIIFGPLFLFCLGVGVACVRTAFAEGINPISRQGKTAVFLAVMVTLLSIPWSAFAFYNLVFGTSP